MDNTSLLQTGKKYTTNKKKFNKTFSHKTHHIYISFFSQKTHHYQNFMLRTFVHILDHNKYMIQQENLSIIGILEVLFHVGKPFAPTIATTIYLLGKLFVKDAGA